MEQRWILKIRAKTLHRGTLSRAVLSVSASTSPHVSVGSIVLSGVETSSLLEVFAMHSNCTLMDLCSSQESRRCQDAWRDELGP